MRKRSRRGRRGACACGSGSISAEHRDDGSCCGMTRDSAGPDARILAMPVRPLAGGCRPTLSPAALPVAEQSSRAGAVTGVGVMQASGNAAADDWFPRRTVARPTSAMATSRIARVRRYLRQGALSSSPEEALHAADADASPCDRLAIGRSGHRAASGFGAADARDCGAARKRSTSPTEVLVADLPPASVH